MYGLYEKFAALIEIAVVCEIVKIFEILSKWRELFRLFRGSTPPKPAFQSVCGSLSVSVAVCLCALVSVCQRVRVSERCHYMVAAPKEKPALS